MSDDQHLDMDSTNASPSSEGDKHQTQSPEDATTAYKAKLEAFENLTLADALGELAGTPIQTWQMIRTIAMMPVTSHRTDQGEDKQIIESHSPHHDRLVGTKSPAPDETSPSDYVPLADTTTDDAADFAVLSEQSARQREALALGLRITAFLLSWIGNGLIGTSALGNTTGLAQGIGLVIVAIAVWLGAEIYLSWRGIIRVFAREAPSNSDSEQSTDEFQFVENAGIHPIRFVLVMVGVIASLATVAYTAGNQFTPLGFFAWMASIVAFAGALASDETLFRRTIWRWQLPQFWHSPTFYALVVIVLVGSFFRLARLDEIPAQMTSDHVEKILDSQRVLDGNTQVFFPNNGGREPLQMYLMAILSLFPGLGMDFYTLKLLSVLEGIITLPFLWWVGRECMGRDNRRLGNLVGLLLAALVAVSHWHTSLSRLALRIVLTPLMASLIVIYLSRAMRFNQRDDFLRTGLLLGAGLYMYQAVRMLPVVVIAGIGMAMIARVRTWANFWRYVNNFLSLVFISFIVFVPMFAFSIQFPELFWRRATGRLLGDSLIETVNPETGAIIMRNATIGERLQAFGDNLPVLGNNIVDVMLMFNYKGDVAWINNAPNAPQMSSLVGALFLLGLAAWAVRIIRHRQMLDWLVPITIFIMLMPSALSIAYPVENPSATRTSGALPFAFLIAAYPLALMLRSLYRLIPTKRVTHGITAGIVGLIMLGSYQQNANTYFNRFHPNYLMSSLPYRQGGEDLQRFNLAVGGRGNAFMIAYPYWWDHRALGLEGGMVDFPNGIVSLENVPQFIYDSFLRAGVYRFDPERPILFFHATEDEQTLAQLQRWFPNGTSQFVDIPEQNRSYATYRVPPMGIEGFAIFLQDTLGLTLGETAPGVE